MIYNGRIPMTTNLLLTPHSEFRHEYECIRSKEGTKIYIQASLSPTTFTESNLYQNYNWSEETKEELPIDMIVVTIPLQDSDDSQDMDHVIDDIDQLDEQVEQQAKGPVPIIRVSSYRTTNNQEFYSTKSILDEDDDEDDNKSRRSLASRVSFAQEVVSNIHTTPRYNREDVPDLFYSRKEIKM